MIKLWSKIGIFFGNFFFPLIIGIIFFLIIFPIGIATKIFKRNFLGIKYDKNLKSYWIEKSHFKKSMKDQS